MDSFSKRVKDVNWAGYQSAYGRAEDVGSQLLALNSADHAKAMDASHQLWCGLCHQHACVSSAALPSYPFLIEILNHACYELKIEILDIILGFAVCSMPSRPVANAEDLKWRTELNSALANDVEIYQGLAGSQNADIRDFAKQIVSELLSNEAEQDETQNDIFKEVEPRGWRAILERLFGN